MCEDAPEDGIDFFGQVTQQESEAARADDETEPGEEEAVQPRSNLIVC